MKRLAMVVVGLWLNLIALPVGAVSTSTSNFYFSDFVGDYYLSRTEDGLSRLKVKESVTAVFPDYQQNKGICRQIAFTNQDGKNITLPDLSQNNLKLTRNGKAEPIYSIEKVENFYNVCTGTEEYLMGEQTYVFEYEFSKVVTEYSEDERVYQELYWDTNGNGSLQRFNKVTARLHFEDQAVWTGESWCYVGVYGASGQERCEISEISDGVEFTAKNLKPKENLTFDVELKADSFMVPEPEKNYFYVWVIAGVGLIALLVMGRALSKFLKSRAKADYYQGLFVKPEYQPSKDYSLPEMTEVYLGKKKDVKVAMLLELVVQHHVEFKKKEGKKWSIVVKDLKDVGEEYRDLLAVLNGGSVPDEGDEIEVKARTATTRLMTLKHMMENAVLKDLKKDELVEEDYKMGDSTKRGVANILAMTFLVTAVLAAALLMMMGMLESYAEDIFHYGMELVFREEFYPVVLTIVMVTTAIYTALSDTAERYNKHTNKGLDASNYMEGLKLYIGMAEADRMKMLQSVEGTDVSDQGIVKLYEKLLPYAAVFGLEESWMNEMKEYCEVREIEEPNYLSTEFTTAELMRTMRSTANYATAATVMSNSGGGASSGFSGGGGGGFSGGGGGGGGFSGR